MAEAYPSPAFTSDRMTKRFEDEESGMLTGEPSNKQHESPAALRI